MSRSHFTFFQIPKSTLTSPRRRCYFTPKVTKSTIFLFCISIAAFLRLVNLYAANFISASIGSEFSSKAYNLTLNQPYRRHIEINSSEIISSIVTQTDVTVSVIKTIILFITSIIISTGLIYSLFMYIYKNDF